MNDSEEMSTLNKVVLNNFIILMRVCVKRARLRIVEKLIKQAKKYKAQGSNSEKLQKRATRLLNEVYFLKSEENTEERALCRLVEDKRVSEKVKHFRQKYPDWEEVVPHLIQLLGLRHRKKKLAKLFCKGKLKSAIEHEQKAFWVFQKYANLNINLKRFELKTKKKDNEKIPKESGSDKAIKGKSEVSLLRLKNDKVKAVTTDSLKVNSLLENENCGSQSVLQLNGINSKNNCEEVMSKRKKKKFTAATEMFIKNKSGTSDLCLSKNTLKSFQKDMDSEILGENKSESVSLLTVPIVIEKHSNEICDSDKDHMNKINKGVKPLKRKTDNKKLLSDKCISNISQETIKHLIENPSHSSECTENNSVSKMVILDLEGLLQQGKHTVELHSEKHCFNSSDDEAFTSKKNKIKGEEQNKSKDKTKKEFFIGWKSDESESDIDEDFNEDNATDKYFRSKMYQQENFYENTNQYLSAGSNSIEKLPQKLCKNTLGIRWKGKPSEQVPQSMNNRDKRNIQLNSFTKSKFNSKATSGIKNSEKDIIHPSWEAKRIARKQAAAIDIFKGSKIIFDE